MRGCRGWLSEWCLKAIKLSVLFACLQGTVARAGEDGPALAYGGGSCGKLEGGVALPCDGGSFEAFTSVACVLGRNYLHPLAAQTILEAWASLAKTHPKRVWQYGDLGWEDGGSFKPHRTHQNGLSADFFVPVRDSEGRAVKVPISAFNKYGYELEFDRHGRLGDLKIDWAALGAHLLALHKSGRRRGVRIRKIILDPQLRRLLLQKVPALNPLRHIFSKYPAWVRHDEHYHIDFAVPQRFRRPLKCKARR